MPEEKIGKVVGFYTHISVAAIELTDGSLKVGDTINIKGATTDLKQKIDSMQIEHKTVKEAKKGSSVGIKVKDRARPNDVVYKIIQKSKI